MSGTFSHGFASKSAFNVTAKAYKDSIDAYDDQQDTINALQSALRAIIARIDGVYDDPDLMAIGSLLPDSTEDVARIAKAVLIHTGARPMNTNEKMMLTTLEFVSDALQTLCNHPAFADDAPEFNEGGVGYIASQLVREAIKKATGD